MEYLNKLVSRVGKEKKNSRTVGPLIRSSQHGLDDSNSNDLTETPAEIDVCGQVATQCNGAYFRCVGNSDCS
jgi:hypothetical protein